MKGTLNLIFRNGPFVLSFLATSIVGALALWKGTDVQTLLPAVLGLYLGHKVSTGISAHWSACKDPDADTGEAIKDVEGIETGKQAEDKVEEKK
jgi:hypothetical protein